MVSKYQFLVNGTRAAEETADFRAGTEKNKMNLGHIEVTVTKELLKNEGMS